LIKVEKVKKKKDPTKEETVCLANGLEVSKFENFKKSSQFLKEPLATELVMRAIILLMMQFSY